MNGYNFFSYGLGDKYNSFYTNGYAAIFGTINRFTYGGNTGVPSLSILSGQLDKGASLSQAFQTLAYAGYDSRNDRYGENVRDTVPRVTAIENCLFGGSK